MSFYMYLCEAVMSASMAIDQSYQSIVENREDAVICVCPTLKTHLAVPKKITFWQPKPPECSPESENERKITVTAILQKV